MGTSAGTTRACADGTATRICTTHACTDGTDTCTPCNRHLHRWIGYLHSYNSHLHRWNRHLHPYNSHLHSNDSHLRRWNEHLCSGKVAVARALLSGLIPRHRLNPLLRGPGELQPLDLFIELTAGAKGRADVGLYQQGCVDDAVLSFVEQLIAGAAGLA